MPRGALWGYFWSDNPRRVQTALGLLWLLDGALQFQSYMYSRAFLQSIADGAQGQPTWLHASIIWAVQVVDYDRLVWNTTYALVQILIGLGLLWRPTVRPALALSFGWVLIVWWFGEAFGMLFTLTAQPLTGAPGAAVMYGIVGLLVWPGRGPGGLLGRRRSRALWAGLWLLMAWLWLLSANSSAGAVSAAMTATDSGIGLIHGLQRDLASATAGDGVAIALILAVTSAAIGIAVAAGWHPRRFLGLAVALNTIFWVVPQGLGGIFAGGATDPNTGAPFVLLALAMYPLAADDSDALGRVGESGRSAGRAVGAATGPP